MAATHVLVWLGDGNQTPTGITYHTDRDRDRQVGRLVADRLTAMAELVDPQDTTWGGYTALAVRLSPPCCPDCYAPTGEPGAYGPCDTCGGEA